MQRPCDEETFREIRCEEGEGVVNTRFVVGSSTQPRGGMSRCEVVSLWE